MKFMRRYKLEIDTNDGDTIVIENPITISFTINRAAMASLNAMKLQIYNLSKETRDRIFQDRFNPRVYKKITLSAGYDYLSVIFKGNIFQANSTRQGNNIITTIDAKDGGFDTVNSQTNKTITAKSVRDAMTEIAGDFPNITVGELNGIDGDFRRPVVLNGNTFDIIRKYANNAVFIDLEKLYSLADNDVIIGELPLLQSDSGLLGTPERNDAFITVSTVFEPRIIVGQLLEIKSQIASVFDGQYKVIGIQHSGTISGAVGGQLTSRFDLLVGSQLLGGFNLVSAD